MEKTEITVGISSLEAIGYIAGDAERRGREIGHKVVPEVRGVNGVRSRP